MEGADIFPLRAICGPASPTEQTYWEQIADDSHGLGTILNTLHVFTLQSQGALNTEEDTINVNALQTSELGPARRSCFPKVIAPAKAETGLKAKHSDPGAHTHNHYHAEKKMQVSYPFWHLLCWLEVLYL